MSIGAIILILLSAILHAGWNLVSKRQHPDGRFFLYANSLGTLLLLPVAIIRIASIRSFPPLVWLSIGATGFCQMFYYVSLAGAYRNGDLSVSYPLARSLPVLMTVLVNLFIGRIGQIGSTAIIGMALIASGGFLLPFRGYTGSSLSRSTRLAIVFALLAAAGTTGYSMIDDHALRHVRALSHGQNDVILDTLAYGFLEGAASSLWLLIFVAAAGRGVRKRPGFAVRAGSGRGAGSSNMQSARLKRETRRVDVRSALLAGAGIYVTYSLVLLSMAFARNVSYIVAFRQVSIPLGTLIGLTILRERRTAPRIIGSALVFAGLVLVAFG